MTTKVNLKTTDPANDKLDVLVHFLFESEKPSARDGLDELTSGAVSAMEKRGDWKGKSKEVQLLYSSNGAKAARLLLVGLGKRDKITPEQLRRAVGVAMPKAMSAKARSVGFVLAGSQVETALAADVAAAAMAEAAVMGAYKFEHHKTQEGENANGSSDGNGTKPKKGREAAPVTNVTIYASASAKGAADAVDLAVIAADAANLTRDIANQPANVATPTWVAQTAVEQGKKVGLKVSVLEKAEMKKLGMGTLLAVAQGSHEPPKLVIMEWDGRGAGAKKKGDTIALVGKGITFDSGGISIKPADKMWEMKYDKCGGCAVIGAMIAVARAKLPLHVVGLVPLVENLPSGTATRPGDIVRSMSGKAVEILNTDAEGRLILADALCYAQRYEPSTVIDIATLTGACVVALGEVRAGLMGNDEALVDELKKVGDFVGEKVWPLPLDEEYGDHIKSEHADIKNLGKAGHAGAISAGFFLKHFAPAKAKWAHLDIAGTAWSADAGKNYVGKGATGFGVRLFVEFLRRRAASPVKSGGKTKKSKAR